MSFKNIFEKRLAKTQWKAGRSKLSNQSNQAEAQKTAGKRQKQAVKNRQAD